MKQLTCREVLDQLQEYLDDAAHADLVHAVDQHLGLCRHCRIEVDTIRGVVKIFQMDRQIVLPEGAAVKLQSALDRAYRDGCDKKDERGPSTF